MPDNEPNGAPAAQPTTPTTPAADGGQQPPQSQQQQQPTSPASEQSPDIRNPEAYRASQEAARYRTDLKAAQARIAEFEAAQRAAEEAQMSELQKTQRDLSELQTLNAQLVAEQQASRLLSDVYRHATKLGVVDLDAAMFFLQSGGELEYDDRGQPTNTEALLTQLLEARPWLHNAPGGAQPQQQMIPRPSAGAPAAPARSATQGGALGGLTRDTIAAMTPREYAQRRDEVMEWLRTHPNG